MMMMMMICHIIIIYIYIILTSTFNFSRDGKGRLPYVIAGSKETRQEFRRFQAEFPDMYDYARSQVCVNLC